VVPKHVICLPRRINWQNYEKNGKVRVTIMRFEFATASRILFGPGVVKELGEIAARIGKKALLTTNEVGREGKNLLDSLCEQGIELCNLFDRHGVEASIFVVPGEPTIDLVREGTRVASERGVDMVIGIGGGSAMDTAKGIAALVSNGGDPLDYVEVIGQGKPILKPSLPCIAVPTTAGTGAEVTRNAVLASPEQRVKVSMRSPSMLPQLALVDPELTYHLPPEVTASTGLDALTQLLEPYVSARANPLTDGICVEGMQRAARSLRRVYENGEDRLAREEMSLASLFGGLALANAGLGVVHGFASVLGGMFSAPHGAICARLLPPVMKVNVRALRQREPENPSLQRYAQIARILTGSPVASLEDGVAWVKELAEALNIPPLSTYGLMEKNFNEVVEKTAVASSTKANPIRLTEEELGEVLKIAL
jgi:alcohol dehydrogenase class IV